MAKILLSIPDEILTKIDEYKDKKKIKRNRFFIDAVESYFQNLWEEEYFERKKRAVESIKKTSKEIMSLDIKDWDPVAEIRKFRDTHTDELLKRWKEK
jgi:metal-responsive CopG/Arc/MetJ family transcriptional regulator